jgi:uncharacterized protein YndB with AHSA1/START domain
MNEKLNYATISLERTYLAPVERVFSAFANPQARARWSVSSNDALVYDKADFREGGHDIFRCGPQNDLKFRGMTTYHTIVPDQCVISTEILTEGRTRLAVALNTLEFQRTTGGTTLKITVQMVSFVGSGVISGYEAGNRGALDGLSRHLTNML